MFSPKIVGLAQGVIAAARVKGARVATAESCTGGLVAGALCQIAGASDVFERGFVTYSNAAKTELLAVPAALIEKVGAVSEAVARAMAEGALTASGAQLAVAITGIAGPGGGSAEKPVGTVHLAAARADGPTLHRRALFAGDREAVQLAAVAAALEMLAAQLG